MRISPGHSKSAEHPKKKSLKWLPYGDNARLILGNSAYGKHSWGGDIYGFAFYRHTLTDLDAALHYKRWSQDRSFEFATDRNPFLLYHLDEQDGSRIIDHAGGGHFLKMPSRMPILKKELLATPWKRFKFDKKSIEDIVLNLAGFILLGFVFTSTLTGFGGAFQKKTAYIALFLCVLVSLIIETAQAWMPSRSSSQLDLMCNTAGSVIGIMIALWMLRKVKISLRLSA